MSEFIKPKTEYASDKEYVEKLLNVQLRKDLHGDEEICSVCKGTGLVIRENPYGLADDPDRTTMFPYRHQTLMFCPHCFNGVVHRCKFCGNIINRGYTKCNCEQQRDFDYKERDLRMVKQLEEAPIIPDELLEKMECFYSNEYRYNDGFFMDWETFFDYWKEYYDSTDPRPEYVWSTEETRISIDAENIIEKATEDLYEDASYDISDKKEKELQDFLDKWCEECGVGKTYYQGKYKVRIPWEDYDNNL